MIKGKVCLRKKERNWRRRKNLGWVGVSQLFSFCFTSHFEWICGRTKILFNFQRKKLPSKFWTKSPTHPSLLSPGWYQQLIKLGEDRFPPMLSLRGLNGIHFFIQTKYFPRAQNHHSHLSSGVSRGQVRCSSGEVNLFSLSDQVVSELPIVHT